jgi:hypothetical protein
VLGQKFAKPNSSPTYIHLCIPEAIFDLAIDDNTFESNEITRTAEPGKSPAVITSERDLPILFGVVINKDESLVHSVLSAAEKPVLASSDVAHTPKLAPTTEQLAPSSAKLGGDRFPPEGRSYENKRRPVAKIFSIVTTTLLGMIPGASKHVSADSDFQVVESHTVKPKRIVRYSLCGCI